ncbi:hypothetical protein SCHPADRAFT_145654 [Schizopora paradoxa]|uniref:Uncharacterized protein n=1 Tax=Schizopora paradoxa TaxID=27342 RepID=A0A0H2SL93_9AGAM|nr:hypothetical protein SCHPADRAFT_145654 [Schizopora paradoxa]
MDTQREAEETIETPHIPSTNGPHVLEILMEYLRELYFASLKEAHSSRWPDDLRNQPGIQKFFAREDEYCIPSFTKDLRFALSTLQVANTLDRRAHAVSRCALGIMSALNFGRDIYYPSQTNPYVGDFRLLGEYTHMLRVHDYNREYNKDEELKEGRLKFTSVLAPKVTSLRVLQLNFESDHSVKQTLEDLLGCALALEELCLTFETRRGIFDMVEDLFGSAQDDLPECAALRIIRLEHFAIRDILTMDRGLPLELSSLHRFKSLEWVHLYDPFRYENHKNEMEKAAFNYCLRKLTWGRAKGTTAFTFDSVWLRDVEICGTMPTLYHQLLSAAPHITLEASYRGAQVAVPVLAGVWSSSRTMTILTNAFPTPDFLVLLPPSLDLLAIKFKAYCCRAGPSFLDRRLCKFVESNGVKNISLYMGIFPDQVYAQSRLRTPQYMEYQDAGFTNCDKLFEKTRASCVARGCNFTLESIFCVKE